MCNVHSCERCLKYEISIFRFQFKSILTVELVDIRSHGPSAPGRANRPLGRRQTSWPQVTSNDLPLLTNPNVTRWPGPAATQAPAAGPRRRRPGRVLGRPPAALEPGGPASPSFSQAFRLRVGSCQWGSSAPLELQIDISVFPRVGGMLSCVIALQTLPVESAFCAPIRVKT